jgi:ornithine carbamoyltransferase
MLIVKMKSNFISISELSSEELNLILKEALAMKQKRTSNLLEGKTLALLFEKPSLRTRLSFEMAMKQQGGDAIYLSPQEVGMGKRESIPDVARVLSRYVDGIAARTFLHQTLLIMAEYSSIPIVNALSNLEHPCQSLADLLTIQEKKGKLKGLSLAYIGDGNNVSNSLLLASSLSGMDFRIASPSGYEIDKDILNQSRKFAAENGGQITLTEDPEQAVRGANIVYTDVWVSMGQENEAEKRRSVFAKYQVTEKLLSLASKSALFMHPLPAHRGEEVSPEMLESCYSVVFDQAENRLYAQKAILARLLLTNNSEVTAL